MASRTQDSDYDRIANKLKGICHDINHTVNFENLAKHKNIVLLIKAPIGAKVQASFFHSIVGIPLLTDEVYHVARVGMSTGVGMEVESKTLFNLTSTRYRPSMINMMKVDSLNSLNNLMVDKSKTKRK